jgi:hypothetical protein
MPEFPALEKSAEAVIAAFHQFLETPDHRPRPLMVRLQVDPGRTARGSLPRRKLDELPKKGEIGPHTTSAIGSRLLQEEIATDAQLSKAKPLSLRLPTSDFQVAIERR